MISEFLSEACGQLWLYQEDIEKHPTVSKAAHVYLKPGKNQEGYWTVQHLIEQVEYKAIPIFEALFSNCTAVFAFDNSSNHAAFKSDALVTSKMNLKSGGKQLKMKDTVFGSNNQRQSMVNEKGELKGMKQVLIERDL